MRGWFGWYCSAGRSSFGRRVLLGFAVLLGALTSSARVVAQPIGVAESSKVRLGFSNLVSRLDEDEIGIAKAELRVHILEALRDAGFNAVGAESLVFDRDEGNR